MVSNDAKEDWAQKHLEAQRKEQEAQRQLQRELHESSHRPNVVCDFPVVNTVMYLRIKNYGNQPAKNVIVAVSDNAIPAVSALGVPISILAPQDELYYWLYGPQEYSSLPPEFTIKVTYVSMDDRPFSYEQRINFAYLGTQGRNPGAGRGLDISRQNNDPIVHALERIGDALRNQ
jgi:hypothetical protein